MKLRRDAAVRWSAWLGANVITDMSDDNQDTIVAIKPCCNHVVFAAVNLPHVVDADLRKDIGELAASGCKIEHWPVEAVRKARWGCKCKST